MYSAREAIQRANRFVWVCRASNVHVYPRCLCFSKECERATPPKNNQTTEKLSCEQAMTDSRLLWASRALTACGGGVGAGGDNPS